MAAGMSPTAAQLLDALQSLTADGQIPEQGGHEQLSFINVFGPLPTHSLSCLTRQYKYTYWWYKNDRMEPFEELFDAENDPLELKNLAQRVRDSGKPFLGVLLNQMDPIHIR